MSKFSNIIFPLFGSLSDPRYIVFTVNGILYAPSPEKTVHIDITTRLYPKYLDRVFYMDALEMPRITYDYTFSNMSSLLRSKVKWGLDVNGKYFKFDKKEVLPLKCARISKIVNNLIWVKGISYPFEIKWKLTETINEFMFANLVQIDLTWHLYNFTYERPTKNKIKL